MSRNPAPTETPASRSLLLLALLTGCSGGVVSVTSPPPGLPLGPVTSLSLGDAGPTDAGPMPGSISGKVSQAAGGPLSGAEVTLEPLGQSVPSADGGDYLFGSIAPGPFTLVVTAPGFHPATVAGNLAPGEWQAEPIVTLQRSSPLLLTADGGPAVDFLAYAPSSGALYAADPQSLMRLDGDGGATELLADDTGVEPIGFTTTGDPVALSGCQATTPNGGFSLNALDCNLSFGAAPPASITFFPEYQYPFVAGDGVLYVSAVGDALSTHNTEEWSLILQDAPGQPILDQVVAPSAKPISGGLAGYRVADTSGEQILFQPFFFGSDGQVNEGLEANFSDEVSGMTSDGQVVALMASIAGDSFFSGDRLLLLQAGGQTQAFEGPLLRAARSLDSGTVSRLVPLSASTLVAATLLGECYFEAADGREALLPGADPAQLAALPDGTPLFLAGGSLQTLAGPTVRFTDPWSQPTIAPATSLGLFPGVPTVYDLSANQTAPLSMAPATATFSRDGTRALVVGATGSLVLLDLHAPAHPVEIALEGTATLALWTPDELGVVYAGTDPLGRKGVFEQAIPQ